MGGSEEEEVMEEKVEDESEENQVMKKKENNVPRFLEDDRLLTALLESTPESRTGKFRGSFGTIGGRRRRRKELVTRLLGGHPGLLEDSSPGLVQLLLARSHRWNFSAFLLDRFSGGHSLSTLCLHLFHKLGLIGHFGLDPADCHSFFRLVESGYHSNNPYHTALHAADVTQAIAVFISQPKIAKHLTKLELLAALTAAVCHDLDHPGVNEKYLVSTGSHLAVLYDNRSVLENHHWRSAIACFIESGLARYLTDSQFSEFADLVRSMVLATDISRQQEFLKLLKHFLDNGDCDMALAPRRHFILQIAIKCADISNPCRLWPVSKLWSLRCCEEFFRQGDAERDLGLPLTPFCDRFNCTVAKLQQGFYTIICEPLYKEWHRFLASPLSASLLTNLYTNQAMWEREVAVEEVIPSPEPMVMPEEEDAEAEVEVAEQLLTKIVSEATTNGGKQLVPTSLKLTRRQSLPATDPFHRIFDQMIQPEVDKDLPRATHLRRNYSLTDRRRSSLLRGLHGRNSLKPLRGRVSRPASVCLESPGSSGQVSNWPLQDKENQENSMDVSTSTGGENNMDNTSCNPNNLPDLLQDKVAMEKENSGTLHSSYERLTRRRGSAPSNLVLADSLRVPLSSCTPPGLLRQQNSLSASNRRGSLPTDLLNESLPKQVRARVSGTSGGGKRAGLLRRRSMGTELLTLVPPGHQPAMKERQLVQKYINRPF